MMISFRVSRILLWEKMKYRRRVTPRNESLPDPTEIAAMEASSRSYGAGNFYREYMIDVSPKDEIKMLPIDVGMRGRIAAMWAQRRVLSGRMDEQGIYSYSLLSSFEIRRIFGGDSLAPKFGSDNHHVVCHENL